ncbi:MAG: hypothetical protein MJ233_03645 [Mycoplasmoidaceae bacterium]|nr:hypothetical protein [Mycoplasmoidaceae bacterium]
MIDKDYINKLASSLYFELTDNEVNKIIGEIKQLDAQLQATNITPKNLKNSPVNYSRAVNCASFRKDQPVKKQDKDYLSNATVVNKYVVGK